MQRSRQRAAEEADASGIDRRRHARIRIDTGEPGDEAAPPADNGLKPGERWQGQARTWDEVRAGLSWATAPEKGRGAKGSSVRRRLNPRQSRMLVLLVALGAGGIAAFLAFRMTTQPTPAETPAPVIVEAAATARVLVASKAVRVGERLSSASLAWQDWPATALQPDYVTLAATPTAISDMAGAVARTEILPGDPIRKEKLAQAADNFLPALIDRNMRGVAVAVTPETASGGFINPNDRVDVVLTRSTEGEKSATSRAETILHNVKVLAIDSRVAPRAPSSGADEVSSNNFNGPVIATLALDPADAEVIVNASTVGKLSLLLRSAADASDKSKADGINQSIRISSPFWTK